MDLKEELKTLIKKIKQATGLGQEEISIEAGYKQKTLTQVLSSGENIEAAIGKLKLRFGIELHESEINLLKVEMLRLNTVIIGIIDVISDLPENPLLKTKDGILHEINRKIPSNQKVVEKERKKEKQVNNNSQNLG